MLPTVSPTFFILFRSVTYQLYIILSSSYTTHSTPHTPQLHTVSQIRYSRYLSCSQEVMFYVNCVLCASFASRSLYQILAIFDVSTLPDVPLSVSASLVLFMLLVFMEGDLIPSQSLCLVLTTAHHRGRSCPLLDTNASHLTYRIYPLRWTGTAR